MSLLVARNVSGDRHLGCQIRRRLNRIGAAKRKGGTVEAGSGGTVESGSETAGLPKKSADERKSLLAQAVANDVRQGWRVESQMDFQAVMVKGQRVNHLLHLILTIFTAGLWGIVWLILVLTGGEKRSVITIDEYGHTNIQR
jgi:hypothetical protein